MKSILLIIFSLLSFYALATSKEEYLSKHSHAAIDLDEEIKSCRLDNMEQMPITKIEQCVSYLNIADNPIYKDYVYKANKLSLGIGALTIFHDNSFEDAQEIKDTYLYEAA